MFKLKLNYSPKFYAGVVIFALNFVIGAIAKIIFFFHFNDPFWRWFAIIIYMISFGMLVLGVWWIGKEYTAALRKYFSYKFYQESLMKSTKKMMRAGAKGTRAMGRKTIAVGGQMKRRSRVVGGKVKSRLKRRKNG
ncbi:MAG: hypothetical protein KJ771_02635, partial [Nanoarchaeota archaeon]|nr:hypothetical protein [Nanoarchaeota archaeon]